MARLHVSVHIERFAQAAEDEQRAGDCMMICISRSRSDRLVLDL